MCAHNTLTTTLDHTTPASVCYYLIQPGIVGTASRPAARCSTFARSSLYMSTTDLLTMRADDFPVDLFLLNLDDYDVFQNKIDEVQKFQVRLILRVISVSFVRFLW